MRTEKAGSEVEEPAKKNEMATKLSVVPPNKRCVKGSDNISEKVRTFLLVSLTLNVIENMLDVAVLFYRRFFYCKSQYNVSTNNIFLSPGS